MTYQEVAMRLLTRNEWGATVPLRSSAGRPVLMQLPVAIVHVHHSVTNADDDHSLESTADVAADMREIEDIGRSRFGLFPYSYCVHPSGVVAEGAGDTIGAHTEGWNSSTYGVCFIGNYENDPATDAQVAAFGEWFRWKVEVGHVRPDAVIVPHRHRKSTACPGARIIERWGDLVAATQGDQMNADQERKLNRVLELLEQDLPAGAGRIGHAVLTTNHYITQILAPQLAALDADQDAQYAALVEAIRAVANGPGAPGAPAPSVAQILDELHARLAA